MLAIDHTMYAGVFADLQELFDFLKTNSSTHFTTNTYILLASN